MYKVNHTRIHYFINNENAFECIDSVEKAYWLGFILADGCVYTYKTQDSKILEIGLKSNDKEHLEKFKTFLNCNHPIKDSEVIDKREKYKGNVSYISRIRIVSNKLCNDLAKYGIISRKGGTCYKSELIPIDFEKYFWLGVLDGDGGVRENVYFKDGNIYSEPHLHICGDKKLMESFKNFCFGLCNEIATNLSPSGKIYTYTLRGPKALIVIKYLYDSPIFLTRKKETAKYLLETYKSKLELFLLKEGA